MKAVERMVEAGLIAGIRGYQYAVAPLLGRNCRFHPSCSEYAAQALGKYGPWIGTVKSVWRLLRCQPYSRGGFDPA
ncbi:MAG: membrane protein insertion efficiency factor YidD [Candidatus Riflebacteria bacterium]|nr:membrane protein insertion efficiency factor YidD [Candidatus Riflebacteria bacterium]